MVDLQNRITATDKTKHAFATFRRSMGNSQKALKGLTAGLGAFVGVASLMRLKQLTSDAVRFGSQISITASKIGVSAKNLQSLRLAGEQFAGIQATTVDMALQRFSRRIGEADSGTGELKDTLLKLGISTRNADGTVKSVTDTLFEYADAIQGAESQQEKLRLAFKGFDSEGAVLVQLLDEGSDNLRRFMLDAQKTGAVMSNVMTNRAKALNVELSLQATIIKTQLSEAFISLAPILLSVLSKISDISRAINSLFKDLETKTRETFEGRSSEAIKEAIAEQERLREANKKRQSEMGSFADFMMFGGVGDPSTNIANITERLKGLNKELAVSQAIDRANSTTGFFDGFAKGLKNIQEQLPSLQDEGMNFAKKFSEGLNGAFDSIIDGTKSVGDALKDFGKTLLKQAIKMFIFRSILAPISGAFGGALEGLMGKATGGSVSKGTPYIVGERGAEMFVPGQSGTIVPNNKLGGSGVVINQTINLSGDVSAQIRSQVLGMLPGIANASRGAVLEAQRRGQPA